MRWAAVLCALAPGCFKPDWPQGLACSEGDTCPPGQHCDLMTNTCTGDDPTRDGGGDGPPFVDGGGDAPPSIRWAELAVGYSHTCAIRESDRLLHCWGENRVGQLGDGTHEHRFAPTPVSGGGRWLSVGAGSAHTCGVREPGELLCFGENLDGQLGDGTAAERNVPTAVMTSVTGWKRTYAGDSHSCAIDGLDGLWCWGNNRAGQLGDGTAVGTRSSPAAIAAGTTWGKLALGADHSCGLQDDGSLWCWGDNPDGRLGLGDTSPRPVPTLVAGAWKDLAVGYFHSCAVTTLDELRCWGYDGGILGIGPQAMSQQLAPATVAGSWRAVGSGRFHTCAVSSDGAMSCFGWNDVGGLGDGSVAPRDIPTPLAGGASAWEEVDGGWNSTCARDVDKRLWCWGRNAFGQLGAIGPGSKNLPGPALPGAFEQVGDAYNSGTCALRAGGAAECWGPNYDGELGVIGPVVIQTPEPVQGGLAFELITRGHGQLFGIAGGRLYGWGGNTNGWLGDGTMLSHDTPTAIGIAADWLWVSSANVGTCGIRAGTGYCWGYGGGGRLGDGTGQDRTAPTLVAGGITTWRQVEISGLHTCGIAEPAVGQRQLHCWGLNNVGQLGDGTTASKSAPARIGTDSDWLLVTLGDMHTCGLRAGGKAYCWGEGAQGQRGDGMLGTRPTPQAVLPVDVSWTALDAGAEVTCGIRTNGSLWCWGSNSMGQAGLGTWETASVSDARQVGAETDWESVRAYDDSVCAMKHGGSVHCWGANHFGTLGDGTSFSTTPTPVVNP